MVNTIEKVDVRATTKMGHRLARFFGLMGAAGLLASAPSCSFIVDSNANQCETSDDCASRIDGAVQCSADKLCIKPAVATECTTNQDCLNVDSNKICRKSDQKCVPLRTPECQTVDGDPSRDDAFVIGSVLPTTEPDDIFGKPVELAIQLALDDIRSQKLGIPTATAGEYRPILYIGCSDLTDGEDTTLKAAKHLAEELKVPAIIGEAFSGLTLSIANEVTIKNGTLLLSPAATSDSITSLIDNDLVWRTSPPDTLQSAALKLYVADVETKVRGYFMANGKMFDDPVKIAIVHNADPYGKGLAAGIIDDPILKINGKPVNDAANAAYFKNVEYDETVTTSQVNVAKDMAESFQPNIILLLGFNEAVTIMTTIESKWMGVPALKPQYIFPDGVPGGDLYTALANDELRSRVTGTIPGTGNAQFQNFVDEYDQKYATEKTAYPGDTFGAAGGYDSVFLLAYAAASLNGKMETGKELALGLMKLSDPTAMTLIDPGAANMSAGFKALLDNGMMNYNGASGPLDFDPNTGEAPSDIQIWCVNKNMNDMSISIKNTGMFFDAVKSALGGAIDANACK